MKYLLLHIIYLLILFNISYQQGCSKRNSCPSEICRDTTLCPFTATIFPVNGVFPQFVSYVIELSECQTLTIPETNTICLKYTTFIQKSICNSIECGAFSTYELTIPIGGGKTRTLVSDLVDFPVDSKHYVTEFCVQGARGKSINVLLTLQQIASTLGECSSPVVLRIGLGFSNSTCNCK